MRITELAIELERRLQAAIQRINRLNNETKIISINAKMEAARAGGTAGSAFGVVAQSIQDISRQTADVSQQLSKHTHETVCELQFVNHEVSTRVRGERLSDLALMNIDVIDRNLYERTCDVRWWATDTSVVEAATEPTRERLAFCTRRLGQILDAYTVYFDIVVADTHGRVVANGRPNQFASVGTLHANRDWFKAALETRDGNEYAFRSMGRSSLAGDQRALIYSAAIRERGDVNGRAIGVLAVIFRWDALAQTIVRRTALPPEEKPLSRVCIVDQSGAILADTQEEFLSKLDLADVPGLLSEPKGFRIVRRENSDWCIAHAIAPGFETYSTNWHSLILQRIPDGT